MKQENDGWDQGALSESATDNLLMLQAEARETARLVRNCERCRASWRDTHEGDVERCTCYKAWKSAVIDLRTALKNAKEERDEWETDDIFDFHTPHCDQERVSDERASEIVAAAAEIGNVVMMEV